MFLECLRHFRDGNRTFQTERGSLVALVDVAINLGIIVGYCVAFLVDATQLGPLLVNSALARVHGLVRLAFVSVHALRHIITGIAAMVNQKIEPDRRQASLQRLARPKLRMLTSMRR